MTTDIQGNRVKEVRVSDASRAEARGFSSLGEVEAQLAKLTAKREKLSAEKRSIEMRLVEITTEVRKGASGATYRNLCDEQVRLKKQMTNVEAQLREIKKEVNPLKDALYEARGTTNGQTQLDMIHRRLSAISDDLRAIKKHLGIH